MNNLKKNIITTQLVPFGGSVVSITFYTIKPNTRNQPVVLLAEDDKGNPWDISVIPRPITVPQRPPMAPE